PGAEERRLEAVARAEAVEPARRRHELLVRRERERPPGVPLVERLSGLEVDDRAPHLRALPRRVVEDRVEPPGERPRPRGRAQRQKEGGGESYFAAQSTLWNKASHGASISTVFIVASASSCANRGAPAKRNV